MTGYKNCLLCPRRCGADREEGRPGFCGETSELRIAFAGIHRGEEPPVTGNGGSGTVFVSGCNLGCAFCQNYQISRGTRAAPGSGHEPGNGCELSRGRALGRAVKKLEFAEICLALEEKGAENINLVTGSHAAPALALGIEEARKRGLHVPVLWNSSGYDGEETLEILKDFVDVYLPDLKTLDSAVAASFFYAPDYPERAAAAILKMMEFRPLRFGPGRSQEPCRKMPGRNPPDNAAGHEKMQARIMSSGVMIRHLVIPGCLESTRQALRWFSENCAGRALLSLMTQYTPVNIPGKDLTPRRKGAKEDSRLSDIIPDTCLTEREYKEVISMLDEFGIEDGFCQELVTGSEWLPDFTRPNPFSSELSVPVWHYARGMI